MKTSSAKAKGRKLQKWMAEKISTLTGIPCGKDELIESREMGQSGVDIKLIGEARKKFPFSIECKNQESWSVPAYIEQAKTNIMPNTNWLLLLKRKGINPIICMDADAFMELMEYTEFPEPKPRQLLRKK